MFEENISRVKEVLSNVSNIKEFREYDGILTKRLENTNLTNKYDEDGNKSNDHQSHIAITGRKSFDLFPYVDIQRYTDLEINDIKMKSFYILQVPFAIFKNNVEYACQDSELPFKDKKKLITNVSIKLSRPKNPQLELGNTSQSEKEFGVFRNLFCHRDCLVILKVKNKLEYEAYIIKKEDADEYKVDSFVDLNPKKNNSTIVKVDNYKKTYNLDKYRNCIYYGAPGTGKSYQLNKDAEIFGENKIRITFHPNMIYGNFIGSYKPVPTRSVDNPITYDFTPGPMLKIIVEALKNPQDPHLLIIEELNRANVAAVFGDIFQLLDRDENGDSLYPIEISEDMNLYLDKAIYSNNNIDDYTKKEIRNKIKDGLVLPDNLYIWATMNSADQGVISPLDTAFKRRWEFNYFGVDDAYNDLQFSRFGKINLTDNNEIAWNDMRQFINNQLSLLNIPEDKLLGPYFLSERILSQSNETVTNAFIDKVLMYLFHDIGAHNRSKLFSTEILRYSKIREQFHEKGEKIFNFSDDLKNKIIDKNYRSSNEN